MPPVVLTVIAVVFAIWGVLAFFSGDFIWGLLLLVLACAIGPGGWSILDRRNRS